MMTKRVCFPHSRVDKSRDLQCPLVWSTRFCPHNSPHANQYASSNVSCFYHAWAFESFKPIHCLRRRGSDTGTRYQSHALVFFRPGYHTVIILFASLKVDPGLFLWQLISYSSFLFNPFNLYHHVYMYLCIYVYISSWIRTEYMFVKQEIQDNYKCPHTVIVTTSGGKFYIHSLGSLKQVGVIFSIF